MHQLDDRMLLVPSHGTGEIECGRNRIKQSTVLMLFKNAPKAFDRVVLAVIRGIVGKLNRELSMVSNLDHALHKLGSSAMIFWAIVLQKQERLHLRKIRTNLLPAVE